MGIGGHISERRSLSFVESFLAPLVSIQNHEEASSPGVSEFSAFWIVTKPCTAGGSVAPRFVPFCNAERIIL
jgi:hypothetical protein